MSVGIFQHPDCGRHDMGLGHPEQPARLPAVHDGLANAGLTERLTWREAPAVTRELLARAHPAAYLDRLAARAPAAGSAALDGDTLLTPHTLPAASRAAGAGVAAVDAVLAGELRAAFAAVRPPGHHAERATAMGFCFYSNIAIAALHALAHHGLTRVAICDFDVHHGNGTEDVVADDPRILFCSTFQYPLFPGKYGPDVPGQRVNCPLAAGTDGAGFREVVRQRWLPALAAFEPELVLISAGFDAHRADPLGSLALTEDDFAWVTATLMRVAEAHAEGRVVSLLEGGYDLPALGRSAAAHVGTLLDPATAPAAD